MVGVRLNIDCKVHYSAIFGLALSSISFSFSYNITTTLTLPLTSIPSSTLTLQTLPPPAVDLELRALCTHVEDEEGLALLHCLLEWMTRCIRTGRDFEVVEAYLHRTLLVHGEFIVTDPALLRRAHVLQVSALMI